MATVLIQLLASQTRNFNGNTFVLKFELVYLPEKFFVARGVRQQNHKIYVSLIYDHSHRLKIYDRNPLEGFLSAF